MTMNDPELMKIMEKDEELVYLYRKNREKDSDINS